MNEHTRPGRRRNSASAAASGSPTSYIYRDENGERLFRVVRGRNKRFYQERFEEGKWVRGTKGVQKTLYNMPAVVDAAQNHRTVWIVEGEKDADALITKGLVATTNPGGAGKWNDEYSYMLMGARRVHIVWDNDEQDPKTGKYPGQEHALKIEASLRALGIPCRLYRAKVGNDLSDHLAAGCTIDQLVQERPGEPLVVPETNGHSKPGAAALEGKPLPAVFQLALFKITQHAEQHGLPLPRKTEYGYEVCCPAHDDKSPSLGIRVGDNQPLVVSCQAGCTLQEIAESLDIDIREFGTKQPDHDAETQKQLTFMRARENARIILLGEQAPEIELPVNNPLRYMTEPPPKFIFTVEELHVTGSNTLVVSQYKAGKALALDTPIPTPEGWTTMGDVKVGNIVFDDSGKQTMVTFATPVQFGRKCYEVLFSDGSTIVADADHIWRTRTLRPKTTREWTTEEIHKTLYTPDGWHLNHRIPVAGALQTEEADLPIDPYVFGTWLGDGTSANNSLTAGDEDVEHFVAELTKAGYSIVSKVRCRTAWRIVFNEPNGTMGRYAVGVKPTLRKLGILGSKRIPSIFLRASFEQRLSLLQGIMDTDGCCSVRGACTVSSVNEELAQDYVELICSLGMKANIRVKVPILNGRKCRRSYCVEFKPFSELPVFRIGRKLVRQQTKPSSATRSMSKTIVSVKQIDSVPVKCIQVDSPSSMYLAGESMTPTHNTSLMLNLFRSLVNVVPFLGHFDVREMDGRVAYLDYEMQRQQFQAWLQAGGSLNYERMVEPWHLRGQSLHFWARGVRERFIDWLVQNEVKVLIVDTAARAWAGLVENENSNSEILRFTDTLDSIKEEAGVSDLFLVTHTGRNISFVPEGEERARGATRLEDWMDGGWYLTKDTAGTRYLRAMGRGVDMEAFALTFEPQTHLLLTNGVSKREYMSQAGVQQVIDLIAAFDGPPSMSELKDLMTGGDNTVKHRWILEAETRGFIIREKGRGRSMRCALTEQGVRIHERRIMMSHRDDEEE